MPYYPNFSPQPLGKVTVAVPGTPVALLTAMLTAVNTRAPGGVVLDALTDLVAANKVYLSSLPANVGSVYIGQQNMVRATLAGVIAIVLKGGTFSFTSNVNLNIYQVNTWYIDADTAGDGLGPGSIDQV